MNTMIKHVSVGFLVVLTLVAACKKAEVGPADDRVSLEYKQSARLNSGVSVTVDTIADSRCPVNAVCIWEGNVIVKASLTKGETKRIQLILGPDPTRQNKNDGNVTTVTLGNETFKVSLLDVTPFPGSGNATKRADIQVTKQ